MVHCKIEDIASSKFTGPIHAIRAFLEVRETELRDQGWSNIAVRQEFYGHNGEYELSFMGDRPETADEAKARIAEEARRQKRLALMEAARLNKLKKEAEQLGHKLVPK